MCGKNVNIFKGLSAESAVVLERKSSNVTVDIIKNVKIIQIYIKDKILSKTS